jgi:uncharacterized membrane protein
MSTSAVMLLRLIHIIIGAFWVGTAVTVALFIVPAVRGAGPAGGAVMGQLQQRKFSVVIMAAAFLTILSGLGLYWNDSAGFTSAWLGSGPGRTFGLGAVLAIVTLILGMSVNAPAAAKLGKIGAAVKAAGGPPSAEQAAEMQRLQARLGMAAVVAATLLVLATAAMAVARYVP